jgi:peptide/nickel transport system substrate-binding protein
MRQHPTLHRRLNFGPKLAQVLACCGLFAIVFSASAQTIRVLNQADALSMDPHSLNESLQLSLTGNVYEPLVGRNKDLSLAPALATQWKAVTPTLWRFTLRSGVRFHDGEPFTADDAVFSLQRAQAEGSEMRSHLQGVVAVRALGRLALEIETSEPNPILPAMLTQVYLMSRSWSQAQGATAPTDRRLGQDNMATLRANGTGPFELRERRPGVRTVFIRNAHYWGAIESNAREVIFVPVANDAQRVEFLLSGQADVMEPVPVGQIARVNQSARAVTGPELRTIFLGMDQQRDELLYASVKGRNPFKDLRVRQAFYQAIDIEDIRRRVMQGAANPAALIVGPGVNGFQADARRLPHDVAGARRLLAEAGYAEGFALTLDCPSGRYVNDTAICQAVAAQLARVGITVTVDVRPRETYLPKVLQRDTSFYLLGWSPSTYDAHNALQALTACINSEGAGQFNLGGYCNPQLDVLTRAIGVEGDAQRRNALLREALLLHAADVGHLPLHQQALAWGVSRKVALVQLADNFMPFKWMRITP